ncbi:MAG TPA: hypothetical protein VF175_15585 [Lacipirellula sp.]
MDLSEYPSLGRLARMNAQLLAHNQTVATVVDGQLDDVERLLRAATDGNWDALLRLSEELAEQPHDRADNTVVRSARKVRDALRRDPSGGKASEPLSELLAACRVAKQRRISCG